MNVITLNTTGAGRTLTLDEIEVLARGEATLVLPRVIGWSTRPRSVKLTDDERFLFDAAKRNGYWRKTPRHVHMLASYWAESVGRPSIEVTEHRRTVEIEMDVYMATGYDTWPDPDVVEDRALALARTFGGRVRCATEEERARLVAELDELVGGKPVQWRLDHMRGRHAVIEVNDGRFHADGDLCEDDAGACDGGRIELVATADVFRLLVPPRAADPDHIRGRSPSESG